MSSKSLSSISTRNERKTYACFGATFARTVAISLVAVATVCRAQTPSTPAPGNMPAPLPAAQPPVGVMPNTRPAAEPVPPPFIAQQQPAIARGTISRFVINPEGDVDGLVLADGTLVHFPPHMSSQLVSVMRPGDTVQIAGLRDSVGNVSAEQITNKRNGKQLADQPPPVDVPRAPPELRGASLVKLSVKGTVMRVTTAPRGEPDGVILKDGTIIKMPPPVAQQFTSLLRPDAVIAARGYGTRNQYGEALQATAFGTPDNITQLYNDLPN